VGSTRPEMQPLVQRRNAFAPRDGRQSRAQLRGTARKTPCSRPGYDLAPMDQPKNVTELDALLDSEQIRFVKVGVFDIDGVLRGKYLARDKLRSAVQHGFGFCDVVLGWDSNDQLYDNTTLSGWHTGYRDARVLLDLSTFRRLPFEPATALILGGFADEYANACPRSLLGRVVDKARSMGFAPKGSLEYEFFLFQETPESAREKAYRNLRPFTPGMFGYSVMRSSVHHELYQELLDTMAAMDCDIEGLHTETGPGVLEAALRYDALERAADKAALFKTFTKVLAQRRGLLATFMAKWSNTYPGQSGHIHISLEDRDGKNLFHDPNAAHGMSPMLRHFVAGQVKFMPEVLAMTCSTINAYRRMIPGFWAPIAANWGVENRTTAIRVIPGSSSQRSEYRIGPADANPYLALSAALASGLAGIAAKLEPPTMITGNAYEHTDEAAGAPLPRTLWDAAQALRASRMAREWFGDVFVEHFAATREWEERSYRKHISDWDLARYFEII